MTTSMIVGGIMMPSVTPAVVEPAGHLLAALAFHGPSQRMRLDEALDQLPTLRDGASRQRDLFFGE